MDQQTIRESCVKQPFDFTFGLAQEKIIGKKPTNYTGEGQKVSTKM